ncbi:F-box/kelch-repeat protein At1g57790-like [Tasmannia lanceolata]|uniref:F-box/kelch-repeat protein At1g57790-like n=1 Tax=Tasmannia lanceolata TaxID=3420 RepID=UPI004063DAA6
MHFSERVVVSRRKRGWVRRESMSFFIHLLLDIGRRLRVIRTTGSSECSVARNFAEDQGGSKIYEAKTETEPSKKMELIGKPHEVDCITEEMAPRTSLLDLPPDVLALIGSHLSRLDLLHLSPLCNIWQNMAHSPVLIFHSRKTICGFFDPILKISHPIQKIPDMEDVTVHCSKDGWLLMSQNKTRIFSKFFFFNPFTKAIIQFPVLCNHFPLHGVALSSSPSSSDCKVFAIANVTPFGLALYTCSHGDNTWTRDGFKNHRRFSLSQCNPVFYDGVFYILGMNGSLGCFDPMKNAWSVLTMADSKKDVAENTWKSLIVQDFLVESGGKLVRVSVYKGGTIRIFCLNHPKKSWGNIFCFNHPKMEWEEIYILDDQTLFLSRHTSISTTMPVIGMQNKIIFRQICCKNQCVVFSLKESSFYLDEDFSNYTGCDYNTWLEPRWYPR